jgi:guanylate kinase
MSRDPYDLRADPILFVLSGPSGAGKDTVLHLVLEALKERAHPHGFVVTLNTRARRPEETEGKDYRFVSKERFAEMIEQNGLLEWAAVYDDYKGVPKQEVEDTLASGQDVFLRLDVQGAATIRRLRSGAVSIFITVESREELVRRLQERKTEAPDALQLRIAMSNKEMERMGEFDYVVVNPREHPEKAVEDVLAIIQAEHCSVRRRVAEQ